MPDTNQCDAGKLAVIYARYSSHTQRDVSIEQQVTACRKYAEENGFEIIRIYDDHAMTGTNDNRPQFQQMIRDSATGAFSFVIVYSLDRFARDRYDSVVHKRTLRENGVKVLSAMENISDDPTGVLMESVLEGFAEYYAKELSQKVRRGLRSNAEKCLANGMLPYGLRRGADGHVEIVPEEAQIIREIFSRVSSGESFSVICRDFNRRGIPTRTGREWHRTSFQTLLHDEKYVGVYVYSDIRIEGGIPPIVDRDVFDRVQEICRNKPRPSNNPQKRRRESGVYLLTGKLYCGLCGAPMIGVSGTGRHGELHFYYVCKGKREKKTCHKKNITRERAEELIATELRGILTRPDVVSWIADAAIEWLKAHQETDEITMLRDRLNTVAKEKANTLKAIRMGVIAVSVQQMLAELEAEESSLSAKLSLAEDKLRTDIDRTDVIAWLESFAHGDVTDKAYQETLFDAFLVRAYLYDDRVKIVFTYNGKDTEDIDVPFTADEVEDKASSEFTVLDSYNGKHSPPLPTYTNISKLYLVAGLFVLVISLEHRK